MICSHRQGLELSVQERHGCFQNHGGSRVGTCKDLAINPILDGIVAVQEMLSKAGSDSVGGMGVLHIDFQPNSHVVDEFKARLGSDLENQGLLRAGSEGGRWHCALSWDSHQGGQMTVLVYMVVDQLVVAGSASYLGSNLQPSLNVGFVRHDEISVTLCKWGGYESGVLLGGCYAKIYPPIPPLIPPIPPFLQ